MKKFKKIWVDMDGVLADFESSFILLDGLTPNQHVDGYGESSFWQLVYEDPNFFLNLDPFHHARELLEVCQVHSEKQVCILSSPSRVNTSLCMIQKRGWIDRNIDSSFPAIFESKKYKYAESGMLLIDDYRDNLEKWEEHEGTGYQFHPHDNPIENLKKYLEDYSADE